ncbi:alpha-amylase family glycosyl hydrolase [Arthrobacter gengyunqii]|uniref:Glycoside hydrolase family 13 protein n=1 Tax=Arthrobacter gengyunqii TaxID=2886940 RepID=A0ABS8GJB3_9MICC|nr:alpha-amylase family glycosyl hydrolase [Arthrobacter gengyunqii]MCC3266761.1 glycoside hydrolase family 13 protein [Arthrobacter gengyunqii]
MDLSNGTEEQMASGRETTWWRDALIYEVYVRSFADSNGDGIGDLPGVTSKLDYLAGLGVDALWLTPFFPSPQADGGYDVSDYRNVDPMYGTLADFKDLLAAAHSRNIRIIVDVVPNHCSDRHPDFEAALAAGPGSEERERFIFRDGAGRDGELPPSDWQSKFGGPAWERVPDGQWYLHIFSKEQPDFNWRHPGVRADFEHTLRFWSDLGVDGFRVDVAHGLMKDLELPLRNTFGADSAPLLSSPEGDDHPFWDRDEVHGVYRQWRKILDEYDPPRLAVAEAGVSLDRLPMYVRTDELDQAFNFFYLRSPWNPDVFRTVIDDALAGVARVGAATSWVLSNHDVVRHRTRYGLPTGTDVLRWSASNGTDPLPDDAAGRRRARASVLLTLALPGAAYLYQGEELGLPEVPDLPADCLQDPIFARTGGAEKGRDGCRVPLPWNADGPGLGFTDGVPWLPQPRDWGSYAASEQEHDAGSFLALYRQAAAVRRQVLATNPGPEISWQDFGADVLAFRRGRLLCLVNFGARDVLLPAGKLILASEPGIREALATDTSAWLLTA